MFKFWVVGEVILEQLIYSQCVLTDWLSQPLGAKLTVSVIFIVQYIHWAPNCHKCKCPYWNRIVRALSDPVAGVSSILAVKTRSSSLLSDAKLTAPSLSTSGWLMALRGTPSDRRSSVSKQTCIPPPQTCLTSACSWHHTNTYLPTATMQSSTSV